MGFKTPDFWYKDKTTIVSKLLYPIAKIYGAISGQRSSQNGEECSVPVICIGNLTAGGSGKTPVSKAVLSIIKASEKFSNPQFLSRGYGRKSKDSFHLSPDMLSNVDYRDVGDEVKLLLKSASVNVDANRLSGARSAIKRGADILIMDDGLQNPTLYKDIKIVVVDGRKGFGNKSVIPAGPLRISLNGGLSDSDAVIIIGEDHYGVSDLVNSIGNTPIFMAKLQAIDPLPTKDATYLAFAGLGLPHKFKSTLEDNDYTLVDFVAFPDHHPYSQDDIASLEEKAKQMGATLITTEKDAVRIKDEWLASSIKTLNVEVKFENENAFRDFLFTRLETIENEKTTLQI